MNKSLKIFMIIFIVVIAVACEENFSPKEDYKTEYILNCVINGRSEFQTAAILSSFDVDNYNPKSNPVNPFIGGAVIKLKYRGNEYIFKDTVMNSITDQRFDGPLSIYYLNNFTPDRNEQLLEIEATLPNGKILSAEAHTPISFRIDQGESTRQIPPADNSSRINIFWVPSSVRYFQYYIIRMLVNYEVVENGNSIANTIEVPTEYRTTENAIKPQYPAPSRMWSSSYSMDVFEQTLASLAETPEERSNISVSRFVKVEVLTFDANLAAYYYAGISENIYTVRLDEIIYSNVEGGYGIFGVTWQEDYKINLSPSYIQRLGYKVLD